MFAVFILFITKKMFWTTDMAIYCKMIKDIKTFDEEGIMHD